MAHIDQNYSVTGVAEGAEGLRCLRDLTLYEACKQLRLLGSPVAGRIVAGGTRSTHGRTVATLNDLHQPVAAGTARQDEQVQLVEDWGEPGSPVRRAP